MYYAYFKGKNSELATELPGVDCTVVARPKDNQSLQLFKYVAKAITAQNPLVVTGNKLYEITSDTTCVKKLELAENDKFGVLDKIDNYPAEGFTHKQYYDEYAALDDTVVARISSESPFTQSILTYTEALAEVKTLEDDVDFTFDKISSEINWEVKNRLAELRMAMSKRGMLLSKLSNIAAANGGYDAANCVVDAFDGDSLVDAYNSDEFNVVNINNETVLQAGSGQESYTFQSLPISVNMTHCFVMGYCISGSFSVQISNDGGANWEDVTFGAGEDSKISNEVTFSESPTGSVLLRVTMDNGDLQYSPILVSWGILWKNV